MSLLTTGSLRPERIPDRRPPNGASGPGGLLAVVAVVALVFGYLLPPFDLQTFLHAGRQVGHGHSPYADPSSPVFQSGHAFVYPLFVAWLFAPLAALPTGIAELVYASASVGAVIAACRMLGRRTHAAAALLLASSTTIVGLQMGTLNAWLLLGLALAWSRRDTRPLVSGAALATVATAKLFLLPVLAWPLVRRRYGSFAAAVATGTALAGIGALLGPLSAARYLRMLTSLTANEQQSSWSLSSALRAVGLSPHLATAVALATVGALAAAAWRRRARMGDGPVLGLAVVASVALSPIVWSSYLVLLAVPLMLVTEGDLYLAGAAVASWLIVTPDEAGPVRVAIGFAMAVALAVGVWRARRSAGLGRAVRLRTVGLRTVGLRTVGLRTVGLRTVGLRAGGEVGRVAGVVVVLVLAARGVLAESVGSALPALGLCFVAGYACLRAEAGAPAAAVAPDRFEVAVD